jgi:hypothetical protein
MELDPRNYLKEILGKRAMERITLKCFSFFLSKISSSLLIYEIHVTSCFDSAGISIIDIFIMLFYS